MNDFFDLLPPDAQDPSARNSILPSASNGTLVTFFKYDEYQGYKSKIEGKRVYEKKDYIRKISDDKSEFCRRVRENDKLQYPKQWAAYLANESSHGIIGTMLDDYAKASGNLSQAELDMLRTNRVYTVEQLSELSDMHMQNIGSGVRKMRTDAAVWLEELKSGTVERQLMAKIAELEAKYESTVESIKTIDPDKHKKDLEAAQAQNQALTEMNKDILEKFTTLSDELAELKKDKEPSKAKAKKK